MQYPFFRVKNKSVRLHWEPMDSITCNCGARLAIPDGFTGSSVRCPACSANVPVDGGEQVPASTRSCPFCAETIPSNVPSCPLCRSSFDETDPGENCPRCGAGMLAGHSFCVHCQSEGEGTGPSPWERRGEIGMVQAIVDTTKGVMLQPKTFFQSIHPTGDHGASLGYGVLVGSVWGILSQLIGLGINLTLFASVAQGQENMLGIGTNVGVTLLFALAMPLFVTIGMYIGSGLMHLGLLMCGGNRNGFEATFRTVCYSQSVQILAVVPIVGGAIAGLWMIIVEIIGLMSMHRTSGGKAAFAVLWVLFLGCGLGIILAVVVGFAVARSQMS